MRDFVCKILSHELANHGFIEELVAQNKTICAISFLGKLFFEPCDLDNVGRTFPWTAVERSPLSHFFAMRLHKNDFIRRKSTRCLELTPLGIRLDKRVMILVFEIQSLANLESISKCTRNRFGSALGSRVLYFPDDANGSNGRAVQMALDGKIFVKLMQFGFTRLIRTLL